MTEDEELPTAAQVSLTDDLTDYKNIIVPDTDRELHILEESEFEGTSNYELVRRKDVKQLIQDKIEEIFDVLEEQAESRKENFEEAEETEAKEWEYGYEAGISDAKKELKEELLEEVSSRE